MNSKIIDGKAFAEGLRGRLVRTTDPDYDSTRALWNAAHDRYPALIVRAAGAADVIRGLEFARSEELTVAVRGGGHSIPGLSSVDGGLVIDLSAMQGIQVDPQRRTARAQPGVEWAVTRTWDAAAAAVEAGLTAARG